MMATRWGRVVAISSLSGIMGNRGQANYAAAKAGLIGAVRALSLELGSRGVTVNAVAPGIIASPAVDTVLTKERIAALVPMKRAGRPDEVAELVAFLASRSRGVHLRPDDLDQRRNCMTLKRQPKWCCLH